jgi:glycosyltransferase involved in cell wall biosynthesis
MTRGRVVHLVRSDTFAGVERYVADTATELAARGWDVTVVGGDATRMRAELPAAVSHRPARSTVEVARELWRIGRCDVVHAHMTAAELPAALLKRSSGARLVVTRHFATRRGRSRPGGIAARLIERRMDVQIAISQFVADSTDTPCVVVHNGVVPSALALPRSPTVLVLQRLEAEKDTATAVRAWALSGLGANGWQLVVHGRGAQESELRSLARALGVADTAHFLGFTPTPRTQVAQASLLLATATAEPFGLAVVEAMAEGTPVVASDSGAHRETLGDDGAYFAPGDVEGAAAALAELAADELERARVGAALRDRQTSRFSVAAHVDVLEKVYAS